MYSNLINDNNTQMIFNYGLKLIYEMGPLIFIIEKTFCNVIKRLRMQDASDIIHHVQEE